MPRANVYFTDNELARLEELADYLGVTRSYIIRLILRDALGFPVGGQGHTELQIVAETRSTHVSFLTWGRAGG